MKKILLFLFVVSFLSCSTNELDPIVITVETFHVKVNSDISFGAHDIEAEVNENQTFMTVYGAMNDASFTLEIGSEDLRAPKLTEGIYSINAAGELVANIKYENENLMTETQRGFFRQIEITSIDFDLGIAYGNFSGVLPVEGTSIHLTNGRFAVIFKQ